MTIDEDASAAGSLWRILITPIDTLKTTLQVEGPKGYRQLQDKARACACVVACVWRACACVWRARARGVRARACGVRLTLSLPFPSSHSVTIARRVERMHAGGVRGPHRAVPGRTRQRARLLRWQVITADGR